MALADYKQVPLPLLEIMDENEAPPQAPDPLSKIYFGLWDDGTSGLVPWIYRDGNAGIKWYVASTQEIIDNAPNYLTDSSNVFWTKTDAAANLTHLRFLGKEVLSLLTDGLPLLEFFHFNKPIEGDTIIMEPTSDLLANTGYLATIK